MTVTPKIIRLQLKFGASGFGATGKNMKTKNMDWKDIAL
jgi:hypothetical protein